MSENNHGSRLQNSETQKRRKGGCIPKILFAQHPEKAGWQTAKVISARKKKKTAIFGLWIPFRKEKKQGVNSCQLFFREKKELRFSAHCYHGGARPKKKKRSGNMGSMAWGKRGNRFFDLCCSKNGPHSERFGSFASKKRRTHKRGQ